MTLNKPNPRLAILRAQLAAKAEAEQLQTGGQTSGMQLLR